MNIILWSFSYNSFLKFHGKNILEPQHDCINLYPNPQV